MTVSLVFSVKPLLASMGNPHMEQWQDDLAHKQSKSNSLRKSDLMRTLWERLRGTENVTRQRKTMEGTVLPSNKTTMVRDLLELQSLVQVDT